MESSKMRQSSGLKAPSTVLRKESTSAVKSGKPSPGTTTRMSPAGSMEKLSKISAPKKVTSASRLADSPTYERKKSTSGTKQASNSTPKMSREASTLSQSGSEKQDKSSESVLSRVKKMEENSLPLTPPSPVHIPSGMDERTEAEYLKLQLKDVTEKLETLRIKRKEDHAKLVDYERSKIQLQSMMELKIKMADQLMDLQRQLQEAKKEALEMREWKEANQDEVNNAAELLEMATIDKEMAEEKAEALQGELDSLKVKVEDLEADLEILREEMASGGGSIALEGNSVQLKQLEQQNERLKEALIKLRDINGQATVEKTAATREAEILRMENIELIRAAELARKTATEAELRIHEYQEQIEAAMGAEEMVMNLTNKNMEMEEQIRLLELDKDELEAHRDMDEQMLEEQKLVEKGLLKEIEDHQIRINELLLKIKQEESHSDELMATIIKFRKKTGELNEEIQDLKDQVLRYEEQLTGQRSEENNMACMASQLQINTGRMFAESVERQISVVELEYAKKQIGYLKAFLPDNFTKAGGDNDSVILSVLFPRLSAKAVLLAKLAAERFPGVPGGTRREHITKSHKAEQWAHSARITYITNALVAVCGQFESAVHTTSLERLARLAQLQPEMSAQERMMDSYLELLRLGRFDENTSLDNLEKGVTYFKNVFSVHVGGDCFDTSEWITQISRQIVNGIAWCRINSQRINFFLLPGSENSEVAEMVENLNDEIAQCEQLAVRTGKGVSADRRLKITSEFADILQSAVHQLEKLASILHETCCIASIQININSEVDGFEPSRLKEMIHGVIEKTHGSITLEKAFEPISKYLRELRENLTQVSSALDGNIMDTVPTEKKGFPPMLERAHLRKQAAAEAEGLRWQLEKKDAEMLELKKIIKSRLDDISNYKLRLDMAEARMDSAGKQDNVRVQHLEAKVEQLVADNKKKQIEFDETMDALQKLLKESERENAELKEMAKKFTKKALLQSIQNMESHAAASISTPIITSAAGIAIGREEISLLENQLTESQESLRRATLEIVHLRSELSLSRSTAGVIRLPDVVCGPNTLKAREPDTIFDNITKEAEQLKRDELKYMMFIPDVSRPRHVQEDDRRRFEKERESYHYKVSTLRSRLHRYWSEMYSGQPFPKLFEFETIQNTHKNDVAYGSKAFNDICNKWGVAA